MSRFDSETFRQYNAILDADQFVELLERHVQIRRARSVISVCVSRPRSGSPMAVAATLYLEMNVIGNPAFAQIFAESVSQTPGKATVPC